MTYCVAMRLDSGILFASDSRTNAGVDHIASFCKMKVFEMQNERVLVVLSSGNLSVTQSVINMLELHRHAELGEPTIWNVSNMYDVAVLVGDALREVQRRDGPYMQQGNIDASASLLVGGQIKGEDPRLFNIYPQGNFIEATPETLYFQLGEGKYGKPVLDRVVTTATNPVDALKCVLVSFDSTIRSNISVGLPPSMCCGTRAIRCAWECRSVWSKAIPTSACCARPGVRACGGCSASSPIPTG